MRPTRRAALGLIALAASPARAAAPDVAPMGERDATTALQTALDKAARAGRPLMLGAGRYRVSTLVLSQNAVLAGVGPGTRIEGTGEAPVLRLTEAGAGLSDLTVTGRSEPALVVAEGVPDLTIARCVLTGSSDGIDITRSGGRIIGCRISALGRYGIFARDGLGLVIAECDVTDCGDGGILIHRSANGPDGSRISGNRIARIAGRSGGTGQNGNGINLFRADDVLVTQNVVSDCVSSGIRANSASNVQIVGNRVRQVTDTAIYVEFGFQGAVIDGNLIDGAVNGIAVTNFNEGGRLATISGNLVRNLSGKPPYAESMTGLGLGIAVEADSAVSGNVVEGAAIGLALGTAAYTRDIAATGNVLRRCDIGIGLAVAAGAGAVVVSGNLVSGARLGIVGLEQYRATTTDLTAAGTTKYRNVTLAGNRVEGN